jgi:hypothetical protein
MDRVLYIFITVHNQTVSSKYINSNVEALARIIPYAPGYDSLTNVTCTKLHTVHLLYGNAYVLYTDMRSPYRTALYQEFYHPPTQSFLSHQCSTEVWSCSCYLLVPTLGC